MGCNDLEAVRAGRLRPITRKTDRIYYHHALRRNRIHRFRVKADREKFIAEHKDAEATPRAAIDKRVYNAERGAHYNQSIAWLPIAEGHELLDESYAGSAQKRSQQ